MNEASSSKAGEGSTPNAKEAAYLALEFADITRTDTACAKFYLKNHNWDLKKSVDAYFGAKKSGGACAFPDGDEHHSKDVVLNINKDVTKFLETATTRPPSEFRLISWNLDGLDDRNLKMRTKSVVKILESQNPDVVFLQEVTLETFDHLILNIKPDDQFEFILGSKKAARYFTVTMLNTSTIKYDSHEVIEFPKSTMGRTLLKVNAHVGPLKLKLLNTHMESMGSRAEERMNQLRISFQELSKTDDSVNVIFGGDLNLRDKELVQVGGLPDKTQDMWEACGSRKECQYTWDSARNSNIQIPGNPRCRFDRVFLRPATSTYAIPKFFGLIGLQKIAGFPCFPSDHWGLLVDYETKETPT